MKQRSTGSSGAYTPNMDMPSRKNGSRGLFALVLLILLPPIGLAYMWRVGVFRSRGRMLLTVLATIEMSFIFALMLPKQQLSSQAPVPVSPAAATIAPDDGTTDALANLDQLLAEQQAEEDASAGITPEPTQDDTAYQAEQQAILATTVYTVYDSGARYYHLETVCGTQSNRRALTVQEAMGLGLGACPECNPPVYYG